MNALAELDLMQNLRLVAAGFDHRELAGRRSHVDASVGRHRRGAVAPLGVETLLEVKGFPGLRVET